MRVFDLEKFAIEGKRFIRPRVPEPIDHFDRFDEAIERLGPVDILDRTEIKCLARTDPEAGSSVDYSIERNSVVCDLGRMSTNGISHTGHQRCRLGVLCDRTEYRKGLPGRPVK